MNSPKQALVSPEAWEELRLYLIFSSFSQFSFPSLSLLPPLDARHKYTSDCLETLCWGGSRITVASCWGDAPHAFTQERGGLQELQTLTSYCSHFLILLSTTVSPKKTHALLSEKCLSLWKLLMSFFFLIRASKAYNSHDVFSFVINLSTGANFCMFLHVLQFSCELREEPHWNFCPKFKSQDCWWSVVPVSRKAVLHHAIFLVDPPMGRQRADQEKNNMKSQWAG